MKDPFYKVYLAGNEKRDISEFIDSLSYEDCINSDSQAEFRVNLKRAMDLLDDDKIETGLKISFQFGYKQAIPSIIHTVILKDIDTDYNQYGVSVTLRALDKGTDMKRSTTAKVWKKSRSSDIAMQIAKKHGLTATVDPTTTVWPSIPQGNMNDMEFLIYLAKRETNGNYITYIRNNELFFVNRGLSKNSQVTFTWGDGNSEIVSFKPQLRESTSHKGASKTTLTGFNLEKQKAVTVGADNYTEKEETTLGDVKIKYNGIQGEKVSQYIEKRIAHPGGRDELNNLANSSKKKGALKLMGATMVILGNPQVIPNTVITINGVAQRHTGNWLIEKVKHDITNSSYLTTLTLLKNGKKKGGDVAKSKNVSVGPKKAKDKIKVLTYDGTSGKQIKPAGK